ncbi:HlyD family efflux transporter periplasmic adaptor subunit [Marinobacter halodurans]|uniref:HlyD family efflux transporter periplasmic adaptor subunit n=1 Tax=Marinobacter halodurans TaxID=2528979 RepID=A0ABY1ZPH9_9GAMM|nr:HlyD family efflux transporter periplasmic adaptor subunit [Marinobacter halodurans]
MKSLLVAGLALGLLSSCDTGPEPLLGTVEWDRIVVLAEASEPITEIAVAEGQSVVKGDLILRQDARRLQAQLDEARATLQQQTARLEELRHGARPETIAAARADLAGAISQARNAELALQRTQTLYQRGTVPKAQLDDRESALDSANAAVESRQAQLNELLQGTRTEQLDQARAAMQSADAKVRQLTVSRERLDVHAPRSGRVDSLPHKLGDQPRARDPLVTLLSGDAPYVRIFVPEARRTGIQAGDRFRVRVDGVGEAFDAVVRSIRSDPAFTPYYALSGDDASRLVYRAELVLQGERAQSLPAGVPAQAWPASTEPHNGD